MARGSPASDNLQAFNRAAEADRKMTGPLLAILEDIAASARIRYDWADLRPVVALQMTTVLQDLQAETQVEVGPARPVEGGKSLPQFMAWLQELLTYHEDGAPFTIQRICELLVEPQKQYSHPDKLAMAFEKLLLVTSTLDRAPSSEENSPSAATSHPSETEPEADPASESEPKFEPEHS